MKSVEKWAKFFGRVKVVERGNQIKVFGVDGLVMANTIARIWETQTVNKQMFTTISDTSFSFNKFFVPDFIHIFERIKQDPKTGWSGKRTLDKVIDGLTRHTWFKVSLQNHPSLVDSTRQSLLKWKAMPHQQEFLEYFGATLPRYDLQGMILAAAPGTGKLQSLDSLIKTPTGWLTMGEMEIGTELLAPDNSVTKVTAVYPQGLVDIYEVILEDGRTAECGLEHLWKAFCYDWKEFHKVLTLEEIIACQQKIYLPVSYPQEKLHFLKKIVSIKHIGQKEAQCIAVDHPSRLYITNDYIVTHNTFTDLLVATCMVPLEIAEIKIIISPKKAVHLVWEKTVKDVFKKPPTCWVCDSGEKMPYEQNEYYIFNFEKLDQAIELAKELVSRKKRYIVIVDESHNFADAKSNRTQKLIQLQTVRDDVYFIWTSGSPILKTAIELISFLKCSDHRFDSDAEQRFRRIYAAAPGRANQIFNHRLGKMLAYIIPKSVVSTTKPTVKELPIKLPPAIAEKFLMSSVREEMRDFIKERLLFYAKNMQEYNKIVDRGLIYHENRLKSRADRLEFDKYQKNLTILMRAPDLMMSDIMAQAKTYERSRLLPSLPPTGRKEFKNALSAVKNIKLKVRGEALGTILSKRRSECAAMLGLYCHPDKIMKESLSKTLFFAGSVLPVKILHKRLTDMGYHALLVYAENNSQLTQQINSFTNDPNINPICATMQSLSEAVPVIAASTVVLLNRPFRQGTWDQVTARADRLGQRFPVTVIEVTLDTGGEPNVSSTTDAILATVRELINDIVGEHFAGPKVDERVYLQAIDASQAIPMVLHQDDEVLV